jgi:hypothetical protein
MLKVRDLSWGDLTNEVLESGKKKYMIRLKGPDVLESLR